MSKSGSITLSHPILDHAGNTGSKHRVTCPACAEACLLTREDLKLWETCISGLATQMAQAAAYGAAELEAQPVGVAVVPAESRGFGGRTRLALCSVSLLAAAALALARSGTGALSSGAAARLDSSYSTDDDALDYFLEYGCGYDDDDAYFLSDTGCISGDAWTCENRLYENDAWTTSGPVPYFRNGSVCHESCSTSLERTWGVPCGWQLIADMPAMCAGTAKPNVTNLLNSRNVEPSGSPMGFDISHYEERTKSYQTQYDCAPSARCARRSSLSRGFVTRPSLLARVRQATCTHFAARARTRTAPSTRTARRR